MEEKTRIVPLGLADEVTVADAARKAKVSEQSAGNRERAFLDAGRASLAAGTSVPSTREAKLEAEIGDLTSALGEAAIEVHAREEVRGGAPRYFQDLEVSRAEVGMATMRFCALIGPPERTCRGHRAGTGAVGKEGRKRTLSLMR